MGLGEGGEVGGAVRGFAWLGGWMVGFEVGLGGDWGGFRLMRWIRNSSAATENSFEFEMHLQNEMETLTLIELLNPTPPWKQ